MIVPQTHTQDSKTRLSMIFNAIIVCMASKIEDGGVQLFSKFNLFINPQNSPYLFTNADWVVKINLFTWQVGGKGNVLFMWLFRKDGTHTSRN